MITLRILGGCEVRDRAGDPAGRIRLTTQQAALLVFLSLARPAGCRTRDQVVAVMWPELSEPRARDALNQAVFRLRELLGHDVITREGEALRLGPVECDAVAFETALGEGRLDAALDLYTGDLLAGVYLSASGDYERWVDEERDRLRSHAVSVALTLAKREEQLGNPVGAVSRLRQALTWEPYDEPIVRDLLRLLDRLGDAASAIRVYESFAARLSAELSLPPPTDLQELVQALRRRRSQPEVPSQPAEPSTRSAGGDIPATPPSAGTGASSVDPERERPRRGNPRTVRFAVASGVVALLAAGGLFQAMRGRASEVAGFVPLARRVVIAPFSNETRDTSHDVLGRMAADWITEGLGRTGLAEVVSAATAFSSLTGARIRAAAETVGMARALGRETRAEILVSGSYFLVGDSLLFKVQITDPTTGTLRTATVEAAGPVRAPERSIEAMRQRTLGALASLLDPRLASWARVASRPPSLEAYQLYVTGLDRPLGDRSAAQRVGYFLRAAALDSTFTIPLIWAVRSFLSTGEWARAESVTRVLESRRAILAPWDRAMLDRYLAELRGNLPESYAAMRRVVELAPNSEWELELANRAMWINRPREAIRRLARFDPEQRQDPTFTRIYWNTLLTSLHLLGDFEGELAQAQRLRRLYGERPLADEAEYLARAALGRGTEVARRADALLASGLRALVLGAVMELRAHGHGAISQPILERLIEWDAAQPPASPPWRDLGRANALFIGGRDAEARVIYERIVAEDSLMWSARGFLGQIQARHGDRAAAEREIAWQIARTDPRDRGEAVIHAAAIAAELGDEERAVQLARRAIALGFYYTHRSIHWQPRLEVLWRIPAARELLRPRG